MHLFCNSFFGVGQVENGLEQGFVLKDRIVSYRVKFSNQSLPTTGVRMPKSPYLGLLITNTHGIPLLVIVGQITIWGYCALWEVHPPLIPP